MVQFLGKIRGQIRGHSFGKLRRRRDGWATSLLHERAPIVADFSHPDALELLIHIAPAEAQLPADRQDGQILVTPWGHKCPQPNRMDEVAGFNLAEADRPNEIRVRKDKAPGLRCPYIYRVAEESDMAEADVFLGTAGGIEDQVDLSVIRQAGAKGGSQTDYHLCRELHFRKPPPDSLDKRLFCDPQQAGGFFEGKDWFGGPSTLGLTAQN